MSEQPKSAVSEKALPNNKAGYACAICGVNVPDLSADAAGSAAQVEKIAAMHRYRPFCSGRCQRIDLGNWLDERYVVPGAPVPRDGGDDPDAQR